VARGGASDVHLAGITGNLVTDKQDAGLGLRKRDRRGPGEGGESGVDGFELRGRDQEGEAPGGGQERCGNGEDVGEALDGAEGYYVEGG